MDNWYPQMIVIIFVYQKKLPLGMVVHSCNPYSGEVEAEKREVLILGYLPSLTPAWAT